MKQFILFFILSVFSLNHTIADDSQKIADLEKALESAFRKLNDEETIIAADELLKYKPNDPTAYYRKATALTYLGKYEEAIIFFDLALKYKYRYLGYYNLGCTYELKGHCLEQLGKLEEALEYYNLSIKHRWHTITVYFAKDRVLMRLGRLGQDGATIIDLWAYYSELRYSKLEKQIVIIADKLLKYRPDCPLLHFEKAASLFFLGHKYEEAIVEYDLALKYGYGFLGELYYERGQCLDLVGRSQEALESYNLSDKYGGRKPGVVSAIYEGK